MEKFKEAFNAQRVQEMAAIFSGAYASFPSEKFLKAVLPKLKEHELKARVQLIAQALAGCLPADPQKSLPLLLKFIASKKNPAGLTGFQAWPLTQFVENCGLEHPELALNVLKEITPVMSAEFAIRVFLLHHRDLCLKIFRQWALDENVHVRRLVSEGSRPRLPWGQRLVDLQRDPKIGLEFLKMLRLDSELYVRKSVANHLNDFSKDHPEWLVKELAAWLAEYPDDPRIRWIVRHASRSLIKAGNPQALQLLGFKKPALKNAQLHISPRTLKLGEALTISFSAQSSKNDSWLIDYAIHHRKKNGELKPKVFKWTSKKVNPAENIELLRRHRFVPISTRVYYGGEHQVEIFVNGIPAAKKSFQLAVSGQRQKPRNKK